MSITEKKIIKTIENSVKSFLDTKSSNNFVELNEENDDFNFEDDPESELDTKKEIDTDIENKLINGYKAPQIIPLDFGYKLALLQSSIHKSGFDSEGLLEDYVGLVLTKYYPFITLDKLKILKGELPVVVKGATIQKLSGIKKLIDELKSRGSIPVTWSNLRAETPELQEKLNNWYVESINDAEKSKHLIDYDIENRTVTSKGKSVIEFFVRILSGKMGDNADEAFFTNENNPYKDMYKGVAWRALVNFFKYALVPIAKNIYGYGGSDAPSWLMEKIDVALLGDGGKIKGVIPSLYQNTINFNPENGNAGSYIMTIAANNMKQLIGKETTRRIDYAGIEHEIDKANANNTGIVVVSKLNPSEANSNSNRNSEKIEGSPYWKYTYFPPEAIKDDIVAAKKNARKSGEKSPLALLKLIKASNLYKGYAHTERLRNAEEYPEINTGNYNENGMNMSDAKQLINSAIVKMMPHLSDIIQFKRYPNQMKNLLLWLLSITGEQNVYAQTTYMKGEDGKEVPVKEGDPVRFNKDGTVKKDINNQIPQTKKVWKTPFRETNDNLKQKQYDRIIDEMKNKYGDDLPKFLKEFNRNVVYEHFDALLRKIRKYFGVVMADFGDEKEKSDKVKWSKVKNRETLDQLHKGVSSASNDIGSPIFESIRNKVRKLISNHYKK